MQERVRRRHAALRGRRGYGRHLPFGQADRSRPLRAPALQYPFPLKNGVTAFPGWNYAGEDQPGGMVENITGKTPPQFPDHVEDEQSDAWINADGFVRLHFVRDAKFNSLKFSPAGFRRAHTRDLGDVRHDRSRSVGVPQSRRQADSQGQRRGLQRSLLQEVSYYKSVVAKMGQARADSFIRFYVTPGVNHGGEGVMGSGAAGAERC